MYGDFQSVALYCNKTKTSSGQFKSLNKLKRPGSQPSRKAFQLDLEEKRCPDQIGKSPKLKESIGNLYSAKIF